MITGHIGEKNFHNLDMITQPQLSKMYRSGLWDFETHTNDLHSLKKGNKSKFLEASNVSATKDIEVSEDELKSKFGKTLTCHCLPLRSNQ